MFVIEKWADTAAKLQMAVKIMGSQKNFQRINPTYLLFDYHPLAMNMYSASKHL